MSNLLTYSCILISDLPEDGFSRHKSSQTFNRYRTIDRPIPPEATVPRTATTSPPPPITPPPPATVSLPLTAPPPMIASLPATAHPQAATAQLMIPTQPATTPTNTPHHRPRYSMRVRTRKIQHDVPDSMTQYQLKPWKTCPKVPSAPTVASPKDTTMPAVTRKETPIHKMNKLQIIRALQWQHPTVTWIHCRRRE